MHKCQKDLKNEKKIIEMYTVVQGQEFDENFVFVISRLVDVCLSFSLFGARNSHVL